MEKRVTSGLKMLKSRVMSNLAMLDINSSGGEIETEGE
jgi:hypothetical protein